MLIMMDGHSLAVPRIGSAAVDIRFVAELLKDAVEMLPR
jgi:hypothetical protein